MKKFLAIILVFLLSGFSSVSAFAWDYPEFPEPTDVQTEILPDGSLFVVTITTNREQKGPVQSITSTKTGSLIRNGITLWEISLQASFDYNGTTAYCTAATSGYTIYNSAWGLHSRNVSKNGNTATANFTFYRYAAGTVVETVNRTLTMSCSASGVVV
ncbi:MAG: hypothetical protein IKX86_06220 [Clostridia bacterium]|nr:hypothetical protein [Clostridia bacterium]MBR5768248.1 hypothetical protein [Clostridia bacterium]